MSKIGVSVRIDVTKLDKARIFNADSGAKYVDLTMFLDPSNPGQYGDHGFITQQTTKEEREAGVKLPILGNGKIFYQEGNQAPQQPQQQGYQQRPNPTYQQAQQQAPQQPNKVDFDDSIPF